jgi:hypothetical protein
MLCHNSYKIPIKNNQQTNKICLAIMKPYSKKFCQLKIPFMKSNILTDIPDQRQEANTDEYQGSACQQAGSITT